MIAKVRIAPVERWCERYANAKTEKNLPLARKLVGITVEILTETMRPAQCDPEARMWFVTEESKRRIGEITGQPATGNPICEHVLEMD